MARVTIAQLNQQIASLEKAGRALSETNARLETKNRDLTEQLNDEIEKAGELDIAYTRAQAAAKVMEKALDDIGRGFGLRHSARARRALNHVRESGE